LGGSAETNRPPQIGHGQIANTDAGVIEVKGPVSTDALMEQETDVQPQGMTARRGIHTRVRQLEFQKIGGIIT
jgi:hypothetical protein